MATNDLTYFNVTGHFYDVEAPDTSGSTSKPQLQWISAFVDFIPRLPGGFTALVSNLDLSPLSQDTADTAVAIAPITARVIEGVLSTVNADDTEGVKLVANTDPIQQALQNHGINELIYDVRFRDVTYALTTQTLKNFAFTAPLDNSTVCITSPQLDRQEYLGPR